MTPGQQTSEWTKALRAEIAGGVLALVGALLVVVRDSLPGAALAAVGGYLIAHTAAAYAHSRSGVKAADAHAKGAAEAAALRPRVPQAPRGL